MLSPAFAVIAAIINLYSDVLYAADTLRGRNKPNRVTWSLWALAPLIGFASQIREGVGIQAVMTLSVGLAPLLVLAATFHNKQSRWAISSFDILCGIISLIALGTLIVTGNGVASLALSMVADFFAALPTIRKAHTHPESESIFPYVLAAVAACMTLLTIKHWGFAVASFSSYILVINLLIAFLAGRKRSLQ
jgi:hypothetical protein